MRLILALLLLSGAEGGAPRRCRGRDRAPCRGLRAGPADQAACRTGRSHHPRYRSAAPRTIPTSGRPGRRRRHAGLVGVRWVLDSAPLFDAVATCDTVTLVRGGIRGLLRACPAELAARVRAGAGA